MKRTTGEVNGTITDLINRNAMKVLLQGKSHKSTVAEEHYAVISWLRDYRHRLAPFTSATDQTNGMSATEH